MHHNPFLIDYLKAIYIGIFYKCFGFKRILLYSSRSRKSGSLKTRFGSSALKPNKPSIAIVVKLLLSHC